MTIPFEKSFASQWRSWWWSDKNKEIPENILKYSNKKYWFYCTECTHNFEALVSNVSNGQWCSYCRGDKLCDNQECQMCFERSIASHPKAKYWSILNDISPRYVLKGSKNKYIFDCNICTHSFSIIISRIISENGWCPYCVNKLCDDNMCEICYNNSFMSNSKSQYWSKDNIISPRDVRKSSIMKFIFNCDKCFHSFSSPLNNIQKGSWCPYCCKNSTLLCNEIDCTLCFEKSFASHPMSLYWSSKNNINPRQVFKKTDRNYIFNCNICNNEFSKRPLSVTYGGWCPYCKNKTENKLYEWLVKHYINIVYQPKYDWCRNPKTNRKLPFDFEYKNIIIELDGPQHFKQISNWRTPEEQNSLDKYKMECAKNNNKHIIRILQKSVLNDSIDWKEELTNSINELLLTTKPSVKYIDIDSSYFE